MADKRILIWGAGKIGRGFIADVFSANGYGIDFVDVDAELISLLNERKQYTLYCIPGENDVTKKILSGFNAYHVSDTQNIDALLTATELLSIVVYPESFPDISKMLLHTIDLRAKAGNHNALNVLIFANIPDAKNLIVSALASLMDDIQRKFCSEHFGFSSAIIIRVAIDAPDELIKEDPLVVYTDGYPDIILDSTGIVTRQPQLKNVRYIDNIDAEARRKLYTYNMAHAYTAYMGHLRGYDMIYEALSDPEICFMVSEALNEAALGLCAEYGYDPEEMAAFNNAVIKKFSNPILNDTLERVGGGLTRKLSREDRLAGPALLCRKHGYYPYYLSKGIACALKFNNPSDSSIPELKKKLIKQDAVTAIQNICGLVNEPDLAYAVSRHYIEKDPSAAENAEKVSLLKEVYTGGFRAEKQYKGCGQCTLLCLFDLFNNRNDALFQAASAFSGGMGICGDGACGAYAGGQMFFSMVSGRRYNEMILDGDKPAQQNSYLCAQLLHDKFIDCYGSVICRDIHRKIFNGRDYCLRSAQVRNEFESAGAHVDKCTTVVANACVWVVEVLIDTGLALPNQLK